MIIIYVTENRNLPIQLTNIPAGSICKSGGLPAHYWDELNSRFGGDDSDDSDSGSDISPSEYHNDRRPYIDKDPCDIFSW